MWTAFATLAAVVLFMTPGLLGVLPTGSHDSPHATPHDATQWHSPTTHEHGHAPPLWATSWSQANFRHGVIYGGDERSSDMENTHKHESYKGMIGTSPAGGTGYLRYHAGTNPLDRCARYHSYELYYKDTSGNVSFWQGTYDAGDPATRRIPRTQPQTSVPATGGMILVVNQPAWDAALHAEVWYPEGRSRQNGAVDFAFYIDSSTLYQVGECSNPEVVSQWVPAPNGNKGINRTAEFFWYEPRDGATPGWFCLGQDGSSVDCAAPGALKQYIAPTLALDVREEFGVRRIRGVGTLSNSGSTKCPNCVLPN